MNPSKSPSDPLQAVVFDLDGLMLNTEDIFALAGEELLLRRSLSMTDEIHHAMLGRRPDEAFQAMKDLTGITDSIVALKEETKLLFGHHAATHLAMMPGLTELLDMVENCNLPKAVATSSPREYLLEMLGRFDLVDRFDFTLAAEDVVQGKPNPEIYLKAANQLELAPKSLLVLEDSQAGVTAASAAGTFAVAVPNRHTEVGDFSMASLRITSLADDRLHSLLAASVG